LEKLEAHLERVQRILRELQELGFLKGFALIGGFAVSARARPRATRDIDFLIVAETREETLKKLNEAAGRAGYQVERHKGNIDDPLDLVRFLDGEGNPVVDLIFPFWKWQSEIVGSATPVEIQLGKSRLKIPVVRSEDLIVLKLKASGPQDLIDAREILLAGWTISGTAGIDLSRLKSLAKRAGVERSLKKILKETNIENG